MAETAALTRCTSSGCDSTGVQDNRRNSVQLQSQDAVCRDFESTSRAISLSTPIETQTFTGSCPPLLTHRDNLFLCLVPTEQRCHQPSRVKTHRTSYPHSCRLSPPTVRHPHTETSLSVRYVWELLQCVCSLRTPEKNISDMQRRKSFKPASRNICSGRAGVEMGSHS